MMRLIYSVSEVTKAIRDAVSVIGEVWVEGEVSNLSRPYSGHIYFTLKDDLAQIRCAIFKPRSQRLMFSLEDGMKVLLHGRVSVYDKAGYYQIIGDRVEPAGLGALQLALEELKRKLAAEGLFDEEHKKPLPRFPERIGIVTSATGAAIRDIIQIIGRRYPNVHLIIHPVTVQGESSAGEIAEAIKTFNRLRNVDLIIVGRGGGSIEDLWSFNEEVVARSIFNSEIPVISAVGHEIDFTISDFVADVRAPTPSAAAELAVPNREELLIRIRQLESRMTDRLKTLIGLRREKLVSLESRLAPESRIDTLHDIGQTIDALILRAANAMTDRVKSLRNNIEIQLERIRGRSPVHTLHERRERLKVIDLRLRYGVKSYLSNRQSDLERAMNRLDALSPLSTLHRGYSICTDDEGRLISSASQVEVGDRVSIRLNEGRLKCRVLEKANG